MIINEHIFILRNKDENLQRFIFYFLFFNKNKISEVSKKKAQDGLNRNNLLNDIKILIPKNYGRISKMFLRFEDKIRLNNKRINELEEQNNKIIEGYLIEK